MANADVHATSRPAAAGMRQPGMLRQTGTERAWRRHSRALREYWRCASCEARPVERAGCALELISCPIDQHQV